MQLPVRPRRPHLGDPLGPGHRQGTPAELRAEPWVQRSNLGRAGALMLRASTRIDTFYGETQVLFGVSLEVGAGEVVALLGPNGAGKTTTLRSILGLTPARARQRSASTARDITRAPTHEIARARHRLGARRPAHLSDADGGAQPRDRAQAARASAPGREKECFEIFSALEYLMQRECENLSGGEMQMVAISRALLGAPGLVLFDEPSQGLAPKVVQDVMKTIARLKSEGIAVLLVEQNVQSALAVADRVYVMDRGRIVHDGPAARAARRRGAAQRSCWGSDDDRAAASRRAAWPSSYTRGLLEPQATFSLRGRLRVDEPGDRRRDGAERLRQDHAVRADHRQQPARRPAACWCDGQDIHRVRYARARPPRDPLPPVLPGARASSAREPDVHAGARRAATRRWCTCSTSRSSTPRTATSASCWTSSAACGSSGKLVFLCLHPNEPYHLEILRESLRALHLRAKGRRDAGARFRHPRTGRFSAHLPWRTCARSMTTSIHHFISGRIVPGTSGRSQDVSSPIPQLALI